MTIQGCQWDQPLADETLLALLDGAAADETTLAHIAECPACAARLREMAATDALLRTLGRVDCPTPETISDLALGTVGWQPRRALHRHIAACPDCAAELAVSCGFLGVAQASTARPATDLDLVGRILAFFPRPVPATAAPWRTGSDGPRHFQAGEHTLSLSIAPVGRRERLLRGRVAPPLAPPAEARFGQAGDDAPRAVVPVEADGSFRAGPLAPGRYSLEIQSGETLLVLDEIEV